MRGDHGRDGVYSSLAWVGRDDTRGPMCGGGGGEEGSEREREGD